MGKILISNTLKAAASGLRLVVSEVDFPAINIPIYQDRENSPEDNAGGAFGISTPYIDNLSISPFNDPNKKFPCEYAHQGERPENDADFYTEQYAAEKKPIEYLMENMKPLKEVDSPKDGYKGPGFKEKFTHGQGDPNPVELYPDTQQGGDLQY